MPAPKDIVIRIDDLTAGQNSADPPNKLGPNQAVAATNVEWYRASVARKRRGSRLVERDSGSNLPTNVKFATIAGTRRLSGSKIAVVIEAADVSSWYTWGLGGTMADFQSAGVAPDTPASFTALAYLNGQWCAAYNSSQSRLHYLSVTDSGNNWYRAGLPAPTTPVITESAGAITDLRKYRSVVYYNATGGPRSEPSTETAVKTLTAEQASAAAPGNAPANELYNRWELQVASDDDNYATWWVVGNAGPTTAIVDNNASILSLEPAPQLGLFEPPPSAKYLGIDGNRLLMAGDYEDTTDEARQQRVWFTPRMGDRDQGDDQRIPDTTDMSNWVDLDGGDNGGAITGFGPSTLGAALVFKHNQIWQLSPTGLLDSPYIPRPIDKSVGTFGYRTVCSGQDERGEPCVYFASARGPMRVKRGGMLEYLGAAIEDVWVRVNQNGNVHTSQHAVYYVDRGQYWLWVSVDTATAPTVLLVFTVRTAAWAVYTGTIATAICSAMLPRFINEDNKGITTTGVLVAPDVPYCCPNTNGQIAECDAVNPQTGIALDTDLETYSGSGSVWTDGTTYSASITTPPVPAELPIDTALTVQHASVFADVSTGVTLQLLLIRDHGLETRTSTALLTAAGAETRVTKRFDAAELANAKEVALTIGDATAIASQWAIHAVQLRVQTEHGH